MAHAGNALATSWPSGSRDAPSTPVAVNSWPNSLRTQLGSREGIAPVIQLIVGQVKHRGQYTPGKAKQLSSAGLRYRQNIVEIHPDSALDVPVTCCCRCIRQR